MATLFKLPYGLRNTDGTEELVDISQITADESGLACNCFCPACGSPLQAKLPRLNKDFTPRFTHHRTSECPYATEAALHLKAKEIIQEAGCIILPEVKAMYEGREKLIPPARTCSFDEVHLEHRLHEMIPDILDVFRQQPIILEIKVTHGIDDLKREKIRSLGISALEIDLSKMDSAFDPDALREQIVDHPENKTWIFNIGVEAELEKLKREVERDYQLQRQAEEKEYELQEKSAHSWKQGTRRSQIV